MPKVTKKDSLDPLQEDVPMQIESGTEGMPHKPHFTPLSTTDKNGQKVEFRRVPVVYDTTACLLAESGMHTDTCATAPADAAEEQLARSVQPHHATHEAGHADELENKEGIVVFNIRARQPGDVLLLCARWK